MQRRFAPGLRGFANPPVSPCKPAHLLPHIFAFRTRIQGTQKYRNSDFAQNRAKGSWGRLASRSYFGFRCGRKARRQSCRKRSEETIRASASEIRNTSPPPFFRIGPFHHQAEAKPPHGAKGEALWPPPSPPKNAPIRRAIVFPPMAPSTAALTARASAMPSSWSAVAAIPAAALT